jgi:hypothetical protein
MYKALFVGEPENLPFAFPPELRREIAQGVQVLTGESSTFMLTVVPEPSTDGLLLVGIVSLAVLAWHRRSSTRTPKLDGAICLAVSRRSRPTDCFAGYNAAPAARC